MRKPINRENVNIKEEIDSNVFQSIFDNSVSGILYENPDTIDIIDVNAAAAIMFGYSIDELRGLNRNDIFNFKHDSMINSLIIRQKSGESKGELTGIRKNGEHFPCGFSSSVFKNADGKNRISTILNDISERKNGRRDVIIIKQYRGMFCFNRQRT